MDFNGDQQSDFLVANDGERNQLWINQGDGTFIDRGVWFGVATNIAGETEASMGIAIGDVNGDLRLDALLTHLDGETNTLYLADGTGTLMDASASSGVGFPSVAYTGFGTALADLDQDADLDLAVANGKVRRGDHSPAVPGGETPLAVFERLYAEPNLIMRNDGGGWFENDCANAAQFCSDAVSRGLLSADVDSDGDLDLLVTNANGSVRLYRNDIPGKGAWLKLDVVDPALNRNAIGALASIRLGEKWQVRPVVHTTSYLSSADATVHFGLGPARSVDEIAVTWPDGTRERFPGGAANRSCGESVNGDPQGHRNRRRHLSMVRARRRIATLVLVAALAGCAEPTPDPDIPSVDMSAMEGPVRTLIEAVTRNLEGARDSAAWGGLDRVYHAHDLYRPAGARREPGGCGPARPPRSDPDANGRGRRRGGIAHPRGAVDPAYAEAQFNLGVLRYGRGQHRDAIARFERTLALDPGFTDAHLNLGSTHAALGEFEAAIGR